MSGSVPVQANDRQTAELHSWCGPRKRGEQKKVLRVEQKESGGEDDSVHFLKHDVSTERTEEAQEPRVREKQEECVERARETAFDKLGNGHKCRLRMSAVVGKT